MLTIRPAEAEDLLPIAEIHVASWRATYRGMLADAIIDAVTVEARLASWRDWSTWPGVYTTVAVSEGDVIGFCRLGPAIDIDTPPPNFAEVTHLYVAPGATGRGIGHALFSEALERARALEYDGLLLWVLEQNEAAQRFYATHGLQFDGTRHTEPAWLGEGVYEVRYRIAFPKSEA